MIKRILIVGGVLHIARHHGAPPKPAAHVLDPAFRYTNAVGSMAPNYLRNRFDAVRAQLAQRGVMA